ncbi:TPA: hypothetical protein QIE23_000921 [Morganella morganii subsp. morganii]|nr:hypothetical protein [Morganella morganii subsp. morganii]HDU8711406.1 hypothetical protein [Morganella morganii subsp. morganii]
MALPERKYYTLDKAAKKIGVEVDDLIHFAAIGLLQLCAKVPQFGFVSFSEDEKMEATPIVIESLSLLLSADSTIESCKDEIDEIKSQYGKTPDRTEYIFEKRFSYRTEYFSVIESIDILGKERKVDRIDGLFAIPCGAIECDEIDIINEMTDEILIDTFDIPRYGQLETSSDYIPSDFYLSDWYEVKVRDLLITKHELDVLANGGEPMESYHSNDKRKNANLQMENINSRRKKELIEQKVMERREKVRKGIVKFLVHCSQDSNTFKYLTTGKINRTKLIECMKDKSVFLFGTDVMPLTDKDSLMPIIADVLDELGLPYTKTKTRD